MKKAKLLLAVLMLVGWGGSAHAGIIALSATESGGNQNFNGTLGIEFTVNEGFEIDVLALGLYDSLGDGFDAESIFYFGIFNSSTESNVINASFLGATFNSFSLEQGYRFRDIPSTFDITLSAGDYVLAAQGFDDLDPNWNAGSGGTAPSVNDGGGAISFTGSTFSRNLGVYEFPDVQDGRPTPRYHSASFKYDARSVPAPATLALMGLGLAGLGLRRRKS